MPTATGMSAALHMDSGFGWKCILNGWPWFAEAGQYAISAYSEFMPAPRLGRRAYGSEDLLLFRPDDPWGWHINEYEQGFELSPGLSAITQLFLEKMVHLAHGRPEHGIPKLDLEGNPYWPPVLARRRGGIKHERFVLILSTALALTQDDKARVRWTLFGSSEQGPEKAFWESFYNASEQASSEPFLDFMRRLLMAAFELPETDLADLHALGLRILPTKKDPRFSYWQCRAFLDEVKPLLLNPNEPIDGIQFLLTFRPFVDLPDDVQKAYLGGRLHLLPFPGSLVFWGMKRYRKLQQQLPFAFQIPLLHLFERQESPQRIRVPQSGWLFEGEASPSASDHRHAGLRQLFERTHRGARVRRDEDELAVTSQEDKVAHVLFSTEPKVLGLYHKPMAHNVQLWSHDFSAVLDGPRASRDDVVRAGTALKAGGLFGYRFLYPAMRVGRHEVSWHRPLVAYRDTKTGKASCLPDAPLGYLTAYNAKAPNLADPIKLWPRLLHREPHVLAVELFQNSKDKLADQHRVNVRKLLDSASLLCTQLPGSFATALVYTKKTETLDKWLYRLPARTNAPNRGRRLAAMLRSLIADPPTSLPLGLTYHRTAKRSFEASYWRTISSLAQGQYLTKNNADCVLDEATQTQLVHHRRDLNLLGEHLLRHYHNVMKTSAPNALLGDLPFQWQTDFQFPWMGGWLHNQTGETFERDLIIVIPGRDRSEAVIMADHYDTAFMQDRYEPAQGGDYARLAAPGADDNHSATATMMLAAPIFLELSAQGQLACDIWLVHLTGEEFPADSLGSRHLCQKLVEGNLQLHVGDGQLRDLSRTQIRGVFLMDMIAHNTRRGRDTFQISPGAGAQSMWLAYQAHIANEIWNASTKEWNRRGSRRNRGRAKRSRNGRSMPATAAHLALRGEVRPPYDPRSTIYNSDGQIFSDAGVPVVLLMENYDINRSGYHDSHDTMANIDLDYGAALSAIAIESVARAAVATQSNA
jgi:hypothetical protein